LLAPLAAAAAPLSGSTPHTRLSLLSETRSLEAGKPFILGVEFQLEDGWHIYWVNAGDSGEAPKVQWTLPAGLTAGATEWPAPERLLAPPLVNYGYENHVLLMVPFAIDRASTLSAGTDLHIEANVRWLVCREVCIPGRAKLNLTLPVRAGSPEKDPEASPFFDEARASLPEPAPSSWRAQVDVQDDGMRLKVSGDPRLKSGAKSAIFFPLDSDQVENATPQNPAATPEGLALSLKRSEQLTTPLDHLRGVLMLRNAGATSSFVIEAPVHEGATPAATKTAAQSLPVMLIFAFLGGLILNLMPCVFPVLSIKILGFVTAPRSERAQFPWHSLGHGLAYTAGILVSFWALVGTLLALRAGGQQLGWGFQLQSPGFIAVLAVFLFGFGLNLAGVFEFNSALSNVGGSLAHKEGLPGSFFTGVLATIVATPCTAPFMGSAVGFALSQSTVVAFLIFTLLGLGLALPYLILSIEPSLGGFLPKPGRWMETFKQFVSFPVFATVLWLAWVFGIQAGIEPLFRLLGGFLLVSVAAWLLGRWTSGRGHLLARIAATLLLVAALGLALSGARVSESAASDLSSNGGSELEWEKFAPEKIESIRDTGRPVFADFTAAWCVSCKVNELLVFRSEEVKSELKRRNFVLMKGDWTTYDPVITRALADFGRSGVPLYVIYPADRGKDPIVLPEIINAGIVLRSLKTLD
jgi:thiol:disulfide interchange protein DsbD